VKIIPLEDKKDTILTLCIDTIKLKKQALVFCPSKKSAESTAEKLSKLLSKSSKNILNVDVENNLLKLSEEIEKVLENPTKQCLRLSECVQKAVAFHHAGLSSKQREIIEDSFREGKISVICSTPTLAAGLDLPAFRAIIKSLKRFSESRTTSIPVLEYLQMAGRAGRPGMEDYGEAIIVSNSEMEIDFFFDNYVNGVVEPIYSKLSLEPVLRMYILSLIASQKTNSKKEIFNFFDSTFYAHQFGDKKSFHYKIESTLDKLKEWNMIEIHSNDKIKDNKKNNDADIDKKKIENTKTETKKNLFTSGLDLLKENSNIKSNYLLDSIVIATPLGKRVSEMYIDPLTAHFFVQMLHKMPKKEHYDEIDYIKLLHLISCSLEIRPLLNVGVNEYDSIVEKSLNFKEDLLVDENSYSEISLDDYECTIKTTLFLIDWSNEFTEDKLLDEYNIRPGEISSKLNIADWLIYSCEELSRINGQLFLQTFLKNSRKRLKEGVKAELLPLLNFKGIGRIRARKLFNSGIKSINDMKTIDVNTLVKIVGVKLTQSLKKQVGIEINLDEIKDELKESDFFNETSVKKQTKKNQKSTQSSLNKFFE
jgi:helicase